MKYINGLIFPWYKLLYRPPPTLLKSSLIYQNTTFGPSESIRRYDSIDFLLSETIYQTIYFRDWTIQKTHSATVFPWFLHTIFFFQQSHATIIGENIESVYYITNIKGQMKKHNNPFPVGHVLLLDIDNVTIVEDYNPCTKQIAQKDEKNGLIKMFYTNNDTRQQFLLRNLDNI